MNLFKSKKGFIYDWPGFLKGFFFGLIIGGGAMVALFWFQVIPMK